MESLQTIKDSQNPTVVFRELPKMPSPEDMRKGLVEERKKMGEGILTTSSEAKTPPLSLYQSIRKRPYSADYFELGDSWEAWNYPKELSTIEEFVKEEINAQGLTDTIESYQEVITKIEDRMGRRFNEKIWHRLDRLNRYIKVIQNFKKWDALKKEIENATT